MWPYRVEFVDGGFEPGVLNVHHGPFLNAAGVIGEVRDPGEGRAAFRDLLYFYVSYAISLVRLPFVRPWDLAQGGFWSRFPRWMDSALRNSGDPKDCTRG